MTEQLKLDKLYSKAYDFIIAYGPRVVIGIIVLLVGLWLIKTVLN